MKNTEKAFLWITEILEKRNIPYKISGGFAARVHGVNRELFDIDIEIANEDINIIYDDVKSYITYGPTQYKDDNCNYELMTLSYEGQEIDISGTYGRILNQKSNKWVDVVTNLQNYELIEVYGKKVPIDTIKSLMAYKSKISREVDIEDIRQLNILKSKPDKQGSHEKGRIDILKTNK
jgi:hypothetical protein